MSQPCEAAGIVNDEIDLERQVDAEGIEEASQSQSQSQSQWLAFHLATPSGQQGKAASASNGPAETTLNGESGAEEKSSSKAAKGSLQRWTTFVTELRRVTLHFTPSWFSVNMGTGISSILLHQLPYQFAGLGIISNVIFGLNVVLFLVFLAISLARYTIWPTMTALLFFHPAQSLFIGTFPMALSTIVAMCALSATPAWGVHFATFTWALWWIDVAVAIVVCIGLPFLQFTRHQVEYKDITGIWFLPVVSTIVVAATGGLVADVLPPSHARLTLIVSWILWGTGFPLAVLLMALYYGRLAIYKIPPATLIVSAFLPLGPCGQGAFGIMKFSESLLKIAQSTGEALIVGQSVEEAETFAQAIYAVSIPIALVIWGLGLVWLVLAVGFLIDLAWVQKLHFNLGWWGFTFPLGVFANATLQFAKELDSKAFRILGTILALIEVALWLFISSRTLLGALSGKLFFSPCLAEMGGEPPKFIPAGRKYRFEPRRSLSANGGGSRSPARSMSVGFRRFGRSLTPSRPSRGRRRDSSSDDV